MSLCLLNFQGDFGQGFTVNLKIWPGDSPSLNMIAGADGRLPPAPDLIILYERWKDAYGKYLSSYHNYLEIVGLSSTDNGPATFAIKGRAVATNASNIQQAENQKQEDYNACVSWENKLIERFNQWLKSLEFSKVIETLRQYLGQAKDVGHRILIQSNDPHLRKMPWTKWDLLKDFSRTEIGLISPNFEKRDIKINRQINKIRILTILGKDANIQGEIEKLATTNIEIRIVTNLAELDEPLWREYWDIIIFNGHSKTEHGTTGEFVLSDTEKLTISNLRGHFNQAIEWGLKLVIFNSCDGLGLAHQLGEGEKLYLSQVIVMRELLPAPVAPIFLGYFFEEFIKGVSLYEAMRLTKDRLLPLEKTQYPGISALPVICQNPVANPLHWFDLVITPNPYQGLSAFQEKDAALFFGRKTFTNQLIKVVETKKLVAVIGASGSGKSSVVLAGLIPSLRQQENWLIASLRPGATPFENLAKALLSPVVQLETGKSEGVAEVNGDEINQLAIDLQEGNRTLSHVVKSIGSSRRFLLVIDQFEEIYTYPNQKSRQFLDCLLDAVQNFSAFRLVITLRVDFLNQAIKYDPFREKLDYWKPEFIGGMERHQLQAVIEEPAKKRNVYLEAGLTEHILNEVGDEQGNLPLLEFALTELWKQQENGLLTRLKYDEIGGVEKALCRHAEGVYDALKKEGDKERTKQIFMKLVSPGEGTEYTRQLATRAEVGEENWDLVTHLATARLVVSNRNQTTEIETVEIVHEALIKAWPDLRKWIEENDTFLRWKKRLKVAFREWERNKNKDGYLLQGAPLGEAEGYLLQRLEDVSKAERVFINLSLEQEKTRQQRELEQERKARKAAQTRTRIAIASTVIVSAVSIFAFWQRNEAIKGQIKALVAEAEFRFSANDQLGAVLASVKAARQLKQSFGLSANEELQTLVKIQQPIYKIQERNRFEGHSDSVDAVSFSPDGKLIASGSADKTVKLWSRDGTLLRTFEGHTGRVSSVSFSPDGKTIVSAGGDQTVRLWNLDGLLKKTMKVKGNLDISDVRFSPDGELIASATRDGIIQVWGVDGTLFKIFVLEANGVDSISWSPNGNILAIANSSGVILIKNDGNILNYIKAYGEPGGGRVSFSPDGKTIAVANAVTRGNNGNNTVSLFDTKGKFLKTLGQEAASRQPGDLILDIQFSPDGKMIAASSGDRTVKILEVDSDEYLDLLITFKGHIGSVNRISFSPDGKTIASASRDKTVRLWSIKYPNVLDAGSDVLSLSFNPDSKTLTTANLYQNESLDYSSTVKLWNVYGILLKDFNIAEPDFARRPLRFNNVHFSNDGQLILIAGKNKGFQLLDWSGNSIHPFDVTDKVRSIAFSSDGKLIATATADKNIKLWNIDGELIRSIPDGKEIYNIYFSPNSQNIVVVDDKQVRVLTLDGKLLTTINIEHGWLTIVAFSPDSKIIATSDYHDQIIKLWNLDGKLMKSLTHKDQSRSVSPSVRSISFSPDGKMIATGYKDLNLWELDGNLIATIQGHGGDINNISFSPDGKVIGITEEYPTGEGNLGYIPSVTFWSRDLDSILRSGCNLLSDYLKTNPNVNESDKRLCNGITNKP